MNTQAPDAQIPPVQPTTQQVQTVNTQDIAYWDDDVSQLGRKALLRRQVEQIIKQNEALGVTTSVSIVDSSKDHVLVEHNEDTVHFAASINKLAVLLLLLEDLRAGDADLDQTMTWTPEDVRAGFGTFDQPGAPLQASLRDVVYDLLNRSGNTAVRIVVNGALGGPAAVNDRLAVKPKLEQTRLIPVDATRFFLGNTTSEESLWITQKIVSRNDRYARFVKDAMATNIFQDFGVRSQLAGNTYVLLINKIGLLDDVDGNNRHDVGVIYNTRNERSVGFSMLTTSPFADAAATEQANKSLMDMGKAMLVFVGDKEPGKKHWPKHKHWHSEHRIEY